MSKQVAAVEAAEHQSTEPSMVRTIPDQASCLCDFISVQTPLAVASLGLA